MFTTKQKAFSHFFASQSSLCQTREMLSWIQSVLILNAKAFYHQSLTPMLTTKLYGREEGMTEKGMKY